MLPKGKSETFPNVQGGLKTARFSFSAFLSSIQTSAYPIFHFAKVNWTNSHLVIILDWEGRVECKNLFKYFCTTGAVS